MESFEIIIAALILASTDFIGILLPVKNYTPRKWWLSFSGGVAVAYVFIHLIPELHKITSVAGDSLTFSFALIGTISYFGAAKYVKNSRDTHDSSLAFTVQMTLACPIFLYRRISP